MIFINVKAKNLNPFHHYFSRFSIINFIGTARGEFSPVRNASVSFSDENLSPLQKKRPKERQHNLQKALEYRPSVNTLSGKDLSRKSRMILHLMQKWGEKQ